MAYSLESYTKDGPDKVSFTSESAVLQATYAKGFRNVAVGATMTFGSYVRTVVAKTDEDTLTVSNVVSTNGTVTWTYKNPALVLSGIYYVKHTKNNKPTVTPSTTRDSDRAFLSRGENGVYREVQLSGWIQSSSLDEVFKNVTILESFNDGSQAPAVGRNNVYTEDVPPRSMYVWISSASWQFSRDKPKWLDVTVNMIERKLTT